MKIKLSEVQAQKSRLKLQLGQVREQLASTKQSLVGVRGSTALEGQVKEAIDAKINNHHLPLLSNYENALTMIERSYSQLIREFKSITGETSDTAIINTDYLTDLKTKVGGILTDSQNLNSEASRIYSSISDILPLSSPSLSEMSQAKSEMDKFLTKLIADMATFDGLSQDKGIESLLTAQNQELSSLGQAVGLGYHHSGASTFFAQTDFRRSVKEVGQVLNSCVDISQLQSALAKEILNSPYSGHIAEGDLAHFRNLDKKSQEEYAKTEAYNTVVKKLNSGEQLSEADINMVLAYVSTHRETELPDNVVKLILATTLSASGVEDSDLEAGLQEVWNQMKENVSVGSITYDVITSSLEEIADNPSTSLHAINAVSGNLSQSIDDLALQANNYFSVRTPYGNIQYASSMVDDLAFSGTQAVTNNAIRAGSVVNFLSRNAGLIKTLTIVYDYESQVSEGTSQTNAAIKTAAHVGISYAAGEVGAIAGAKIGAAIGTVAIPFPIVGTITGAVLGTIAGFAIGIGLSIVGTAVFDAVYDTYIGEHVDNAVDKAKEIVEDVGGAVSSWCGGLGSAFG